MSMVTRKSRLGRILDVVGKHAVRSQNGLASLLRREGVDVTQSTLSRDIRHLGLVKVRGCYQVPGMLPAAPPDEDLRRALAQFVIRTGISGNIVMIKTSPGNAHSVGVVLDAAAWPEMLGTVAGDDTIFVLLRDGRFGKRVLTRIRELSA